MTAPQAAPDPTTPAGAAAYEADIAARAAAIRGDAVELTPALLLALVPLLREPIPAAYIQQIGVTEGKPYESTGIRSVQVQVNRMDAVLTPLWWRDVPEYEQDGKLCRVTVQVGNPPPEAGTMGAVVGAGRVLVSRSSYGGVQRGSSTGNIYKGSYTNAAKRAFALVGPGHEVYLGEADLDPDVNEAVASQQEAPAPSEKAAELGATLAGKLVDRAWKVEAAKQALQLAASHVADRNVGDCSTKAKATKALAKLTYAQAERLDTWLQGKEADAGGS